MNIYLYGNCQTTALRMMIAQAQPNWKVSNLDLSTVPVFDDAIVGAHFRRATAADIVVAQPVGTLHGRADLSSYALRASLPPHVTMLTFPSMFFNGLQGCFDYASGHVPIYRSAYHNAHTIEMFLSSYHWQDITTIQSAPEFYTREFVFGRIETALAELRRREHKHQTTIRLSPFLEERCRSELTMNTVNHPKRPALVAVLRDIFKALGLTATVPMAGEELLPLPFYPPLPSVLHHLELADTAPMFLFHNGVVSRAAQIIESLRLYAHFGRKTTRQLFDGSRLETFIEAFRQTPGTPADVPDKPATLSLSTDLLVADGFRMLLRRAPADGEVAEHARAIENMGLFKWLSFILESAEYMALNATPEPSEDARAHACNGEPVN